MRRGCVCTTRFAPARRQLRRLAGTGFAGDHDHLVLGDERTEFLGPLGDRQAGRNIKFHSFATKSGSNA